ncbi:hypothetical protein FB451DRAFT_1360429 [Mycena latifolia]|nr:hypothetical protein FB451DRAFT_1360429 [Mycena latifolia]
MFSVFYSIYHAITTPNRDFHRRNVFEKPTRVLHHRPTNRREPNSAPMGLDLMGVVPIDSIAPIQLLKLALDSRIRALLHCPTRRRQVSATLSFLFPATWDVFVSVRRFGDDEHLGEVDGGFWASADVPKYKVVPLQLLDIDPERTSWAYTLAVEIKWASENWDQSTLVDSAISTVSGGGPRRSMSLVPFKNNVVPLATLVLEPHDHEFMKPRTKRKSSHASPQDFIELKRVADSTFRNGDLLRFAHLVGGAGKNESCAGRNGGEDGAGEGEGPCGFASSDRRAVLKRGWVGSCNEVGVSVELWPIRVGDRKGKYGVGVLRFGCVSAVQKSTQIENAGTHTIHPQAPILVCNTAFLLLTLI